MKQFRLSRQTPGATLTKFHIYDGAGDIVGSINVANEEADDLQRHWLGGATQPKAAAITKKGGVLAEALAAKRQPGALAPAHGKEQNPMVTAMARAAKRNRLTKQAMLRGC